MVANAVIGHRRCLRPIRPTLLKLDVTPNAVSQECDGRQCHYQSYWAYHNHGQYILNNNGSVMGT
eukprot:scaffold12788_cov139-Skeletonema_dohrnii-CCMP3373.AAC.4